jgi:hypothetical protein
MSFVLDIGMYFVKLIQLINHIILSKFECQLGIVFTGHQQNIDMF